MHTLRGAMTIDSLASATNNNFQSDPNINGTGRMDGNTATALVPLEYKPGDNALDAFRHELLLSRRSTQYHAYFNVILRDSTPAFFPTGTPVATGDVVLSFGTCVLFANMTMDNIIKSYLADLGDARTELEYFLAHLSRKPCLRVEPHELCLRVETTRTMPAGGWHANYVTRTLPVFGTTRTLPAGGSHANSACGRLPRELCNANSNSACG